MKKNNELDFNFDNIPYKSAKPSARSVDRTAQRENTPSPSPAPTAQHSTYRWGNAAAPSNMLTRDEIMHLNDTEAPRGRSSSAVKDRQTPVNNETAGGKAMPTSAEPEKIPMTQHRTSPSVKAEPNPSDGNGFSSAALEIMRRMQRTENARADGNMPKASTQEKSSGLTFNSEAIASVEVEPKPRTISFSSNESTAESIVENTAENTAENTVKNTAENTAENTIKSTVEKVEPIAQPVNAENNTIAAQPLEDEPVPVMPIRVIENSAQPPIHIADEAEAVAARIAKAEQFELDRSAMAEGMDKLELDVTESVDSQDDTEGTRLFGAISETAVQDDSTDRTATRYVNIPECFDEMYTEDNSEEQTEIDEYNSVEDAQSVTYDLMSRKRRLGMRSFATALIALLLIAITCSDSLFPFGQPPYFIAVGAMLAIAVLLNITTFSSLISVFTMKPDADFAPAFAVFAASVQTAVSAFIGTQGVAHTSMFAAAAVLSLAVNTIGKHLTVSRTLANFELIANEEVKQAGAFIAPPVSESVADKSKLGETLIFGRHDTIDLKGFISYSLSPDYYEKQSGRMSLVTLLASLVSFAVALLVSGTVGSAVGSFAATACAAAQIAAIYPGAALLSHSCRKLHAKRVMLSGVKAAEEISEANVIVLDSDELFSGDGVNLYKFRTFGNCAPDEAFMVAYALAMEGHSPLADMFGKICATQGGGMYKADSVIYENSMGITGWVNERKTLLGNRMIMESHSIPVPSMEVDRKILQSGKAPVYLAIDNKISALFIVGYEADKTMLHRVRRLINTGVTILVRTVDPNVTADLVCDCYGLPSDAVMIMESNASHIYCNRMKSTENAPALLSAPTADGFVDAYIESYAVNRRNKAASVAVIVLACVMMALTIILPAIGMTGVINIVSTLISYAVTLVLTAIIMAFLG